MKVDRQAVSETSKPKNERKVDSEGVWTGSPPIILEWRRRRSSTVTSNDAACAWENFLGSQWPLRKKNSKHAERSRQHKPTLEVHFITAKVLPSPS